jgi:hypothetical protein
MKTCAAEWGLSLVVAVLFAFAFMQYRRASEESSLCEMTYMNPGYSPVQHASLRNGRGYSLQQYLEGTSNEGISWVYLTCCYTTC